MCPLFASLFGALCCLFRTRAALQLRDCRPPPPDQCAAQVTARAGSPASGGPALLDVAAPPLVGLALFPPHRQTGDCDRLASQGIPSVLELEEPPPTTRKAGTGDGGSRT